MCIYVFVGMFMFTDLFVSVLVADKMGARKNVGIRINGFWARVTEEKRNSNELEEMILDIK